MDPSNPLLERLKFVGIVSSNMDEFFMVRVASLKASGEPLEPILKKARSFWRRAMIIFSKPWCRNWRPRASYASGRNPASPAAGFPDNYFRKEIFPVLTPIAISSDRPLPVLSNLRLHFVAGLVDPKQRSERHYAVVEIPPKIFPRMVFLPTEKWYPFVLIEDLIAAYAAELFPGYEVTEKGVMRLTRGAELTFDEEKDEDFMRVMTEALRERRTGDIVRLEVSADEPWSRALCHRLSRNGCRWQVPARRLSGASGRLKVAPGRGLTSRSIAANVTGMRAQTDFMFHELASRCRLILDLIYPLIQLAKLTRYSRNVSRGR